MATLKNSAIKYGFTEEGVRKFFIYERDKTHEQNEDIERQITYLKENFPCREDYLLPIRTTDKTGKVFYEHIINKRKKFNKYLKKMAMIMEFTEGLDDLSIYFAPHSFAMTLFIKPRILISFQ